MEHSDRGKWVTHLVQVWIENDGKRIGKARAAAREGAGALAVHLTTVLRSATEHSSPWQTAQDLAPNDYDRVDWEGIAKDLLDSEAEVTEYERERGTSDR